MMKKITFYLMVSLMFVSVISFAQGTVTGTITDSDLGAPLSGANVIEDGTANGAITDFDGNFSLSVDGNSGTVTISYLGYLNQSVSYLLTNGTANIGSVSMTADENYLTEVVLIGTGIIDMAGDRKTPVAVSTITSNEIQAKVVGNVEITEAIKSTPSAFISGQTGFGDSQLYLRGFDQTNIGVLLNGQPVNGMEDGKVYWSNWAGIADIANAVQVQRGLGSSKLAISSVGGTMNIVMKTTQKKERGFVRLMGGNDSYFKGTVAWDSGINDKGWAFSFLVDHWQAHRKWAKGTFGAGQNYYASVGYKPNDTHSFNFLITGAPQQHGQKWSQSREILDADPKFNQHWGYRNGSTDIESERTNFYHKPVTNLNWDWVIGDNTELSTVAYASWGRGGGTGPRGNRDAVFRTDDPDGDGRPLYGQLDYPAIEANNAIVGVGDNDIDDEGSGYIRRASMNNHQWYGLITNLSHDINENLSFNVGGDFRTYTGTHFRQINEFYGLTGWSNDRDDDAVVTDSFSINPWETLFNFADEGQRINYDYSEDINYQGGFGQIEYANDKFSIFAQGSYSSQFYQRNGRMGEVGESEKLTKTGYNIKGGVSYNIDEHNTMFLNAGKYSRQPFLDNIFVNVRSSNEFVEPGVENEDITSFEAGYHFSVNNFSANFNAYVTDWDNRVLLSSGTIEVEDPKGGVEEIDVNIFERGVRQYHSGGEFDLNYRVCSSVRLKGYISAGSYVYKGESSFEIYNDDTNELIDSGEGNDRSGIKVSTAPQFTTGFGFDWDIISDLRLDGSINYQANHYEFTAEDTTENPGRLKPYSLSDLGLTYNFNLGNSNELTFRANVYNIMDEIRIQQSDRFGYFNTNGRTFNASMRYEF